MKYLISGIEFKNKEAVKKKVSAILNSYDYYQEINEEDEKFIRDFFEYKFGDQSYYIHLMHGDIKNISINRSDMGGSKGFKINYKDGTFALPSYIKCATSKRTKLEMFKDACRHTISEQILKFKNSKERLAF